MRARKKAFTLIELLVVIAIIALLLAILVPALRTARKLARRAICSSRLHDAGVALCSYAAGDHAGRFPESNGYKLNHIPLTAYESLKALSPDVQKIFICPDYLMFKEQHVTGCSIPELNRVYRWEPFPDSYNIPARVGVWIGYNYLGGRDFSTWDWRFRPPDTSKWKSPRRLSDPGTLALMVDLVEQAWGEPDSWTEAVHRKNGWARVAWGGQPLEPEEIGAEGGNDLYLDGSVFWYDINKLQKYPRSRPGQYRSFAYWSCDY